MTMRTALRTSSNRAAAQMIRAVGIDETVAYAKKLELGDMPAVPSLALGAGEVTLADMTMAFGAFADHGLVRDPVLIRKVVDREGNVLFEAEDESRRAVEEATAFFMADMLTDVIDHGTAYGARQEGFRLPAAGKTGTTNDYVDGWFVGFTPSLVAGVWVGFDKPKTIFRGGYAAQVAVPIWARFMRDATRGDKAEWFERPKDIVGVAVCRVSGKLATDGCRAGEIVYDDFGGATSRSFAVTQYYRKGVAPSEYCDLHGGHYLGGSPVAYGAPPPAGSIAPAPSPAGAVPAPAPFPSPSEPGAVTGGTLPGDAAVRPPAEPPKKPSVWRRIFGGNAKTAEQRQREEEEKKARDAEKKAREQERKRLEEERRRAERERREQERKPPPPAPKPPVCCEG
jgi:penicillin-binding protein 1A